MTAVWKYVIPFDSPITLTTPRHEFRPVLVGIDPATNQAAVWAEVDTSGYVPYDRTFVVKATGEEYDRDTHRHIGSFSMYPHTVLVWHLFEVLEPLPEGAE